jgi:hypothetical protein
MTSKPPEATTTPPGPREAQLGLSSLVLTPGSISSEAAPDQPAGQIDDGSALPELPPEMASALTRRERLLAVELARGSSWGEALTVAGYPPSARIRDKTPPERVKRAAAWLINALCVRASQSKLWIINELLVLYRRAAQAEPVLDRRGRPTGTYRFDGPTAKNCLELMGRELGMFGQRQAGGGIPVGDVAQLLQAVASRGRPDLPALVGESRRETAPPGSASQPLDSTPGAAQQPEPASA